MKEACLICKAPHQLAVGMEKTQPICTGSYQNNRCLGKRCPFVGGKV